MSDSRDELIPPTDPRFEGAEYVSRAAIIQHKVLTSDYLQSATWTWSVWEERAAVMYDPATGEESPTVWDHDHCHFCHENAFSIQYDDDLREGWTTDGPAGLPLDERQPKYHWVCPECFERYKDQFAWRINS